MRETASRRGQAQRHARKLRKDIRDLRTRPKGSKLTYRFFVTAATLLSGITTLVWSSSSRSDCTSTSSGKTALLRALLFRNTANCANQKPPDVVRKRSVLLDEIVVRRNRIAIVVAPLLALRLGKFFGQRPFEGGRKIDAGFARGGEQVAADADIGGALGGCGFGMWRGMGTSARCAEASTWDAHRKCAFLCWAVPVRRACRESSTTRQRR